MKQRTIMFQQLVQIQELHRFVNQGFPYQINSTTSRLTATYCQNFCHFINYCNLNLTCEIYFPRNQTFPLIGEHTSTLELWEGKFQFHHQVCSYELACSRVEPFHFPSICRPRMSGVLLSIQKGHLAKAT